MSAIRNILYVTGFKRPMNTGVSFEDISGVSLFGAELVAQETAADARTLLEVIGTAELAAEALARTQADAALASIDALLDERINDLELASGSYVTGTGLALTLQSYAPKASPALTGIPTAPTAATGTNTTQLATTAFVRGEIDTLIGGAPGALDTLNELAAALGNDSNFAGTVTNSLAGKATLAGANVFTDSNTFLTGYGGLSFYAGPDGAPSARNGITVEQITGSTVITVGYNGVLSESVLKIGAGLVMANGTWDFADTTIVNLPYASLAGGNSIYGTNHFLLSNAFDSLDVTSPSGVAFRATNTGLTTLVEIGTDGGAAQVANLIIGANVVNAMGTWNFNGTVSGISQNAVTGLTDDLAAIVGVLASKASLTDLALKAPLSSPALTGVPTAPTATAGTNTTQLATTAFVMSALSTGYVTLAGEQTLTGKKYFNGGLEAGSGTYNSFANVAQLGLPNESVINAGGGSIIRGGTELHLGSNGGNWLTMGNGTMTMRGTWDFNLATVTNFGTSKVTGLDTALADKLSKGVQALSTAEQLQVKKNIGINSVGGVSVDACYGNIHQELIFAIDQACDLIWYGKPVDGMFACWGVDGGTVGGFAVGDYVMLSVYGNMMGELQPIPTEACHYLVRYDGAGGYTLRNLDTGAVSGAIFFGIHPRTIVEDGYETTFSGDRIWSQRYNRTLTDDELKAIVGGGRPASVFASGSLISDHRQDSVVRSGIWCDMSGFGRDFRTPTSLVSFKPICPVESVTRTIPCATVSTTIPGFVNGSPHTTVALTTTNAPYLAAVKAGDTLYVSTPSTDLPAGFQVVSVRCASDGVITLKMVNNTFNDESCGVIPLNIVHVIR